MNSEELSNAVITNSLFHKKVSIINFTQVHLNLNDCLKREKSELIPICLMQMGIFVQKTEVYLTMKGEFVKI